MGTPPVTPYVGQTVLYRLTATERAIAGGNQIYDVVPLLVTAEFDVAVSGHAFLTNGPGGADLPGRTIFIAYALQASEGGNYPHTAGQFAPIY